jgi:predicted ester cyclase
MIRSILLGLLASLAIATNSSAQDFRLVSPDTIHFGDVPLGAYIYKTIEVENLLNESIEIFDAGDLTWESEAWTTIYPSMVEEDVFVMPNATREIMTASVFDEEYETTGSTTLSKMWQDFGDETEVPYFVSGRGTMAGMGPYWDELNQDYTIYPGQTIGVPVLIFESDQIATYNFLNYSGSNIQVSDLSMWLGDATQIVEISHGPAPFTLQKDGLLTVKVKYGFPDRFPYDMVIVQTQAPMDMKSIRLFDGIEVASVDQSTAAKLQLEVFPNPASEQVRFSLPNVEKMSIAVLDMAGSQVYVGLGEKSIVWDRRSSSGERVANGAYQVVAAGRDRAGKPVVATGKIMLQ